MDASQHLAIPATDWMVVARFVALGLTFALVAAGGLANRLVIYRDWNDLFWSCAPAGFALGGLVLGMILGSGQPNGGAAVAAVVLLAGLGIAVSLFMSLRCAVHCNGLVVGLAVFAFKIAVALLLIAALLPQFFGRRDAAGRQLPANFLLLGALAGLACLLVNGDRVARPLGTGHHRVRFPVLPGAPQ